MQADADHVGPLIWIDLPEDGGMPGHVIDFHELVIDWILSNRSLPSEGYVREAENLAAAFDAAAKIIRKSINDRK